MLIVAILEALSVYLSDKKRKIAEIEQIKIKIDPKNSIKLSFSLKKIEAAKTVTKAFREAIIVKTEA